MATEVIMPQLGESVVEGTVTRWLKAEGDPIEEFEALVEINTDKVDTEVPSPASGTVLKLYVAENQTVQAGTLLAVVGEPGEEIPEAPVAPVKPKAAAAEPAAAVAAAPAPAPAAKELGFISPVVARIAAEHKLDLARIQGSGRGGRITKKDALAAVKSGCDERRSLGFARLGRALPPVGGGLRGQRQAAPAGSRTRRARSSRIPRSGARSPRTWCARWRPARMSRP